MIRFAIIVGMFTMALPAQASLRVVASMPDYAALAKAVGGDYVEVTSLANASQDPHYVDAKPSYVVALNRADLVIFNGLELEVGWMPTLLVQARNPNLASGTPGHLDVGTVIQSLLDVPTGPIDRSMGDVHPGGNPHYSYDPLRMAELTNVIAVRLSHLDPANASSYTANGEALKKELVAVAKAARAKFDALPARSKRVVEYHKSFAYLFETLGIEVVARVEPKPGVAPSPGQVAQVVSTIKREGIQVLVQEVYNPARVAKTIAKITGASHVMLPGGVEFGDNQTYTQRIEETIEMIYNACKQGVNHDG